MERWRREFPGLALVLLAMAFNAWFAAPEMRISQLPVNDLTFHLAASERLNERFTNGEPFLDPWVSEWALGYPVWFSYQLLPHVAAALVFRLFHGFASNAASRQRRYGVFSDASLKAAPTLPTLAPARASAMRR